MLHWFDDVLVQDFHPMKKVPQNWLMSWQLAYDYLIFIFIVLFLSINTEWNHETSCG